MKKLLTFTLLTIIAGTSQASYTYHLALQNTNSTSGALPEGSIRFVKAGDGTGLPPTEVITPPPVVDGGSGETEYSEEQSCLVESNANSAKALIEQYQNATFGGLFYSSTSEKSCIVHAYLPRKTYDQSCKFTNGARLNALMGNMDTTMFGFTYEFTGGC